MELIRDTVRRFNQRFGVEPDIVLTAPGRVNLLGEHTDYNEGFVLPVAIDKQIFVAAGLREDDEIHIYAIDLLKSVRLTLTELDSPDVVGTNNVTWSSYPIGVLKLLKSVGAQIRGVNICYRGTIPMNSGLSSSAAVEVACLTALSRLFQFPLSPFEIIRNAQRAEVEFVGVPCGIMDQFISVMGKRHKAVYLDCRTLHYEYIPCPSGLRLVVCDTGMRRELAYSAYFERREECNLAVRYFAQLDPDVQTLRDVSKDVFLKEEKNLDPVLRKRARHVIFENERVQRGVRALQKGDIEEFGKMMIDSHMSLRDLFEVSCKELDAFVDIAIESEGVFGARMTGAGFGGCGICLVKDEMIDPLVERLRKEYPQKAGRSMTIYIAGVENGATVYNLKELHLPVLIAP